MLLTFSPATPWRETRGVSYDFAGSIGFRLKSDHRAHGLISVQNLIFEDKYEFIPPFRRKWFTSAFKLYLRKYLRSAHGIVADECRGIEHLKNSLSEGHGIILAPNHCRPSDPMAMGLLTIEANTFIYAMAGWHVFKQDWLTRAVAWRLGAFSVYREGMDRAALNCGIDILDRAERPLVVFPEGCISRTNDQLGVLMEGVSFIARTAARRRAKRTPAGKVVVHPIALRYHFQGDVDESLSPVLDDIESRMSWQPQRHLTLVARIAKVGRALICLKELEYLGTPQSGSIYQRIERMIDHLLVSKEREWLNGHRASDTVSRVKALRAALLPDMVDGDISDEERERRWRQLADLYLAQQLVFYPRRYIRPDSSPERLVETVERIEEDLTDVARVHGPMKLIMQVGEAIEVSPKRQRNATVDPLMQKLESDLQSMIDDLTDELGQQDAA
jgi:1-acyl-sn-glycerol-3-phosphate acyltransferase